MQSPRAGRYEGQLRRNGQPLPFGQWTAPGGADLAGFEQDPADAVGSVRSIANDTPLTPECGAARNDPAVRWSGSLVPPTMYKLPEAAIIDRLLGDESC